MLLCYFNLVATICFLYLPFTYTHSVFLSTTWLHATSPHMEVWLSTFYASCIWWFYTVLPWFYLHAQNFVLKLVNCVYAANARNKNSGYNVQMPVSGNPVVSMPAINLNMGMDLWNKSDGSRSIKKQPDHSGPSQPVYILSDNTFAPGRTRIEETEKEPIQ